MSASSSDKLKLTLPVLLLAALVSTMSWLCYEIGARTASATLDVIAFKAAIREELELRLKAEQRLSQSERAEIAEDAKEAKSLARQALRKPVPPVVLAVKTPVPVQIVEPKPTPTVMPDTNPKSGGLIDLFR